MASTSEQAADGVLRRLWDQTWPTIAQRLDTVERCAAAWMAGDVSDQLWRDAQRDAHRLAGSLGLFGLADASEIALRLDRLLRSSPQAADARAADEYVRALRHALEPQPRAAPAPLDPARAALPRQRSRVLIADDDDNVARAIQAALRLDGCEVIRARDGEEAVRIGREQAVDLILLDLNMPGLDGFGACQALRADPRLTATPIVLLTAQMDRAERAAGLAAGATDCMAKPFSVAELRAAVRGWLRRSEAVTTATPV